VLELKKKKGDLEKKIASLETIEHNLSSGGEANHTPQQPSTLKQMSSTVIYDSIPAVYYTYERLKLILLNNL